MRSNVAAGGVEEDRDPTCAAIRLKSQYRRTDNGLAYTEEQANYHRDLDAAQFLEADNPLE